MPELTVIHIVFLAASMLVGIVVGWIFRGSRTANEKTAINSGWQEQLAAQRGEHERLLEQNKSLMEQNSQYQASNKDAKMRASELSGALKEAFERRDELQRQIKEIRGNLEVAINERDQLQSRATDGAKTDAAIKERDDKIFKLSRELENWQDRLPPLIDRFKKRNEDAEKLEEELAAARERIVALESMVGSEQTRVEPVDADALGDDLDASNEPIEDEQEDLVAVEDLVDDEEPAADEVDAGDDVMDTHSRDNLKQIKGVGPAIEKTLNEMGIFRFNQIAEMSEYDIDRVAHRLKGFRSRIYREDWMGQARDLQVQKASG
jgi:predicted flap endonuclease-1-like 5' DNA nuclease